LPGVDGRAVIWNPGAQHAHLKEQAIRIHLML
jgi:hypothetical protein